MGYAFETLPDYLRPGLALVLVGINPGVNSVVRGHYFASPWSRFWPAFSRSRLGVTVCRQLGVRALRPEHDARLMDFGIGFTDVVKRPTTNAAGLTPGDFAEWAPRLRRRVRRAGPRVVCFHGVTAYGNFLRFGLGQPRWPTLGPQAECLGPTRIFVVPNPSGANAHFHAADLARWYDRLARFVGAGQASGFGRGRNFRASQARCYHDALDRKESRWNL
ncbi:MAG TPA: mismatch-specific DNA-glycosylase [Methylomirabilota bacterium]